MKDEIFNADRNDLSYTFGASAKSTLTVDVEKYQAMLDGSGLTEEEKKQVLEALWSIIVNFVELGFEVHPLQEVCGKNLAVERQCAKGAFDEVNLEELVKD
jgi:hypothetical protein